MKNSQENLPIPEEETYESTGLYESAFLICKGIPLYDIFVDPHGKATFVFPSNGSQRQFSYDFINGCEVSAQGYTERIRTLKSMIKNAQGNRGGRYNG